MDPRNLLFPATQILSRLSSTLVSIPNMWALAWSGREGAIEWRVPVFRSRLVFLNTPGSKSSSSGGGEGRRWTGVPLPVFRGAVGDATGDKARWTLCYAAWIRERTYGRSPDPLTGSTGCDRPNAT